MSAYHLCINVISLFQILCLVSICVLNTYSTWRSRSEMPDQKLRCGAPECGFETPEVDIATAVVLLQYHRQDYHAQVGAGGGGGGVAQGARQATGKLSKKPDRQSLDMDTTEGEWGIFEDSWARYKRMTGLEDMATIRDELRECCSKQLNTRLVQMNGPTALESYDESKLLEVIKTIAVKGVHKEVHRAAFQGMHQQQAEIYQAYAARLKAKADLGQYSIKAPKCGDDLCTCSGHGRQLYYRDEMVGTQLVAGAYNKEHQARLLSESATLLTLQDKLDRLCTLEKSESSSATLSGQVQLSAGVKEVEVKRVDANKCSSCHRVHKMCGKCQRVHPCTVECYNCHKKGHVRSCCPAPKRVEDSKPVGEVHEMVAEAEAFSMELVALEFMAGQETARINKEHKRARQRAGRVRPKGFHKPEMVSKKDAILKGGEEECLICQVGRGMEKFVAEGIDHMEWDNSRGGFVKTSPREPSLLRVGVKVLHRYRSSS